MKKRAAILTAVSLLSVFNAACMPAPEPAEIASHDAAVSAMTDLSLQRCADSKRPSYAARLQQLLNEQKTETLQTLQKHDVAICLDTRLQNQAGDAKPYKGIYYAAQKVMALSDDLKLQEYSSGYDGEKFTSGHRYLNHLASMLKDNNPSVQQGEAYYTYHYRSRGRSRTGMETESLASAQAQARIAANPWMREAPLAQQQTAPSVTTTVTFQAPKA